MSPNYRIWLKRLINTYYCKICSLVGRYPTSIIPQAHFVSLLNIPRINTIPGIYIVRRSDKNLDEIFNTAGEVRVSAIDIDIQAVPGMSMNILGGFYKLEYIKFTTLGLAAKPWTPGTEIFFSDYKKSVHYHTLSPAVPILFPLSKLNTEELYPFAIKKDDMRKPNVKSFLDSLDLKQRNDDTSIKFKIEIVHKPTNLNYWHVELKVTAINNNVEKTVKVADKDPRLSIAQHIRDQILVKAAKPAFLIKDIQNLSPDFYCESLVG